MRRAAEKGSGRRGRWRRSAPGLTAGLPRLMRQLGLRERRVPPLRTRGALARLHGERSAVEDHDRRDAVFLQQLDSSEAEADELVRRQPLAQLGRARQRASVEPGVGVHGSALPGVLREMRALLDRARRGVQLVDAHDDATNSTVCEVSTSADPGSTSPPPEPQLS